MDKALKQRLVGASVLILLAVIVLPMLLSGQSDTLQQETVRIEVPERPPELTFETRRFPVGDVTPGAPSTLPADDATQAPLPAAGLAPVPGVVEDDAAPAEGVTIAASPAPGELDGDAPATPEPAGDDETDASEPVAATEDPDGAADPVADAGAEPVTPPLPVGVPEASPGRYLVQVASYTISANADNLASKLETLGMDVLRDTVENDANRYHRVRVGPFDEAGDAQAAIAEITREISDLQPRIVDLKPDELAPVTDPGDPLVRWVVQAGSFASDTNADQLVSTLRAAGYEAYREKVSEASTTLFKVRIGPELRRETAVEVAARLEREFDIRGLVMSTD